MPFTKQDAAEIQGLIRESLEAIYAGDAVDVHAVNVRWEEAEIKITAVLRTHTVNGETREERDFKTYAVQNGMQPSWLGLSFKAGNQTCTIVGYATSKTKRPVVLDVDGKRMIATPTYVSSHMGVLGRRVETPKPPVTIPVNIDIQSLKDEFVVTLDQED